jgi:NhaP-type Na+/H+ or K+/H+ antiporter
LALVAEGVLFFVVGAFIFNIQTEDSEDQKKFSFSWVMIAVGIGSVVIARVVNVFLMSLIGFLIIGKKKWKLNFY